jgi:hypothetical protein
MIMVIESDNVKFGAMKPPGEMEGEINDWLLFGGKSRGARWVSSLVTCSLHSTLTRSRIIVLPKTSQRRKIIGQNIGFARGKRYGFE